MGKEFQEDTAFRYGKTIRWTDWLGSHVVSVDDCKTPEEANTKVYEFAREQGWTPPKWWQWWRWGDSR